MKKRPFIFITNDDSSKAPGLRVLINEMKKLGDVFIVAPDDLRSGQSHSITVNQPIRRSLLHEEEGFTEYSCSGTPVDCVKLGLKVLLDRRPDLLVSGINHGSNASINMLYSGTMAAALEGAMEGIPSIGFSICDYGWNAEMKDAAPHVLAIAEKVLEYSLPKGTALNVNIPAYSDEAIKGVKICKQGDGKWDEEFDNRIDPRNQPYSWIKGNFVCNNIEEDSDLWALKNNYIAVVPVHTDLTNHEAISGLRDILK